MATLGDSLIFGKINIAAGTPLRDALTALLSWQHGDRRWQLGETASAETPAMTFEHENLLAALHRLTSSLSAQVLWDWDFSTAPWTLHLRPMSAAVGTELRLSRNIDAITLNLDRSELCTRLYPIGKNGLTIAAVNGGDCALTAPNASLYGLAEEVYRNASIEDASVLLAEAQATLNRRCTPRLRARVDARDLSVRTKEPLDEIRLGRLCRVPAAGGRQRADGAHRRRHLAGRIRPPRGGGGGAIRAAGAFPRPARASRKHKQLITKG